MLSVTMLFTKIIIRFVVCSDCYYEVWTDAILGILNSCAILPAGKRVKFSVHPRTGHEGPKGEYRYHCTVSLTLVLDGGRYSMPHLSYFAARRRPSTHCTGGCVGPNTHMDRSIRYCPNRDLLPRLQPAVSWYTNHAVFYWLVEERILELPF
jgi:hypothetical protein